MVQVNSVVGEVVLASDAAHYYEVLEYDRPFNLFTSLPDMYRAYDIVRDLATRPQTRVIAGHDPLWSARCSRRSGPSVWTSQRLCPHGESSPIFRSHASTSARASLASSPRTATASPIVDRGQSRV